MKLLKIKLKNINSLKGEHEVNFTTTPLVETGLILITGPTGSGKSTLLDAITLGLYGNVPRLQKPAITKDDIDGLGTILTHHTKEASVEVFYEIKGTAYVSKWSVKVNRNNAMNAIEMQLAYAATNEMIEDKKNDVLRANENLICLTYDQFQKAILLSQGDFAKFLQSKNEDRLKLLETMIGADIYRKIGRETFEYHKRLDNELKTNQQIVENYVVKSAEEITMAQEKLAILLKEGTYLDQQIKLFSDQKTKMEQVSDQKVKLNVAKDNHINAHKILDSLRPNIELISKHDELLESHDDIKLYLQMAANTKGEQTKILGLKDKLASLRKDKTALVNEAAEVFPRSAIDENQFTEKLEELRIVLERIDGDSSRVKNELINRYQELIKTIGGTPKEYLLTDIKNGLQEFKNNLEARLSELTTLFESQGISYKTSTVELSQSLILLDQKKQRCTEYKNIVAEHANSHKDRNLQLEKMKYSQSSIKEAQAAMLVLNEEREELQKRLAEIDVEKQKQLVGHKHEEARTILLEGEPCPLCGSLDHPYVTDKVVFQIGTLEIEQISVKKKIGDLDNQLSTQNTKKSTNEGIARQLKSLIEEIESKILSLQDKTLIFQNELKLSIESIHAEIQDIDLNKKSISGQIANLECHRYLHPLLVLTKGYIDVKTKQLEIDNQLKSVSILDRPLDILTKITANYDLLKKEFTRHNALLNKASTDLDDHIITMQELSDRLLPTVNSKGYKNIEEAFGSLLEQSQVDKMFLEINNAENFCKIYENEIAQLSTEIIKNESGITINKTIEEVANELEKVGVQNKIINQEIGEINAVLNINEENKKYRDAKMNEIADQLNHIKKWRLLSDLIGDATGKKYANFAQSLTLDMILDIANRRLKGFTDRYSLKRSNEDLYIMDHYMADKERNVRTLSGGETFIVSLALALGLSDLASQNVKLECLFIDEGFGTLDEDTLDMVVTTLEKLQQDSSKTIGIISHIDYLKDRISTQIQLEKSGNGISTFKIVA